MKIEIKKGDKFLCVSNRTDAKKGKIYPAFSKEYIDVEGFGYNLHAIDPDVFQPLSSAKWAIKRTPENADEVNRWANEKFDKELESNFNFVDNTGMCCIDLRDDYTEIDLTTFREITGGGEDKYLEAHTAFHNQMGNYIGETTEEWQHKWINAENELPDDSHGRVLVWVKEINDLGISEYCWNCSFDTLSKTFSDNFKIYNVTHWMPLPDKPLETHTFTTEQAKQYLAKLHNLNPEQIKITE